MDGIDDYKEYMNSLQKELQTKGEATLIVDKFYENKFGKENWNKKKDQLAAFKTKPTIYSLPVKRSVSSNAYQDGILFLNPDDSDFASSVGHEVSHALQDNLAKTQPEIFEEIYGGKRTEEGAPFYSTDPIMARTPSATELGDSWEEVIAYALETQGRRPIFSSKEFWEDYKQNKNDNKYSYIRNVLEEIKENPEALNRFNMLITRQVQARPSIRINPKTNKLEFYPQT